MRVSHDRGKAFEDEVCDALEQRSWKVIGRNVSIDGIEIDIVAIDPDGRRWWIECKGGEAERSGLARPDTVKRALGTAWALRDSETLRSGTYFIVTCTMPRPGSMAHRLVVDAVDAGLIVGAGTIGAMLALHDVTLGVLPDGIARRTPLPEW